MSKQNALKKMLKTEKSNWKLFRDENATELLEFYRKACTKVKRTCYLHSAVSVGVYDIRYNIKWDVISVDLLHFHSIDWSG